MQSIFFATKHARKYYYMAYHTELSMQGVRNLKTEIMLFWNGIPKHALENMWKLETSVFRKPIIITCK